jgi:FAD/FMN-containing dehydrogenase
LQTLSKFSNNFPVAIVYPTNTEQVQAAVKCGKAARVKVLPRCGNHGNEGG